MRLPTVEDLRVVLREAEDAAVVVGRRHGDAERREPLLVQVLHEQAAAQVEDLALAADGAEGRGVQTLPQGAELVGKVADRGRLQGQCPNGLAREDEVCFDRSASLHGGGS